MKDKEMWTEQRVVLPWKHELTKPQRQWQEKPLMIKQNPILFICIFNNNTEIQVAGLAVPL